MTAIVSAPVVTNGIVAGEPTEFNLLLNAPGTDVETAFDPGEFGHQIPAGGRMEVELSGAIITISPNGDSATNTIVVEKP